jgi:hypothetical protein
VRPPPASREIVLRSPDGRDVLRLAAIRRDSGYPSLEVRIEARSKGFSGASDVWVDGFALKEFTAALRELERSRQGRLELRSMSPDELSLVLRSMDHAGHLVVEFAIARVVLVGDRPEPVSLRVAGAFELDPGILGEALSGFAQLAKAVAS